MRVLLLDNLDSFTHNLAQVFGGLGAEVVTCRNDVPLAVLLSVRPDRLVVSPGPGGPERTGHCGAVLDALERSIPVLGVCLGMQLLARRAGAVVERAPRPVHGRATPLAHDGRGVFAGLPQGLPAGRYHSLAVRASSLPLEWEASAWSEGVLMGLRHVLLPVEGVQFHPESILTPWGSELLGNFLRR